MKNPEPKDSKSYPRRASYKLAEAASIIGVSVVTLRRAIKRGVLFPIRAFRHILISQTEIDRFTEATAIMRLDGETKTSPAVAQRAAKLKMQLQPTCPELEHINSIPKKSVTPLTEGGAE